MGYERKDTYGDAVVRSRRDILRDNQRRKTTLFYRCRTVPTINMLSFGTTLLFFWFIAQAIVAGLMLTDVIDLDGGNRDSFVTASTITTGIAIFLLTLIVVRYVNHNRNLTHTHVITVLAPAFVMAVIFVAEFVAARITLNTIDEDIGGNFDDDDAWDAEKIDAQQSQGRILLLFMIAPLILTWPMLASWASHSMPECRADVNEFLQDTYERDAQKDAEEWLSRDTKKSTGGASRQRGSKKKSKNGARKFSSITEA